MPNHKKHEHLSEKELQQIKKLKSKMINYGFKYGLSHPRTVEVSQELDTYLNKIRKR